MEEKGLLEKLHQYLDENRIRHSIGVKESSQRLAQRYGGDVERAGLAGLLHDCAKGFSDGRLMRLCEKYQVKLDEVCLQEKELIHGPLGARLALEVFNVRDPIVLGAIECHTTGKRGMNQLERIIYLADFIEPSRSYPGVEALRELAEEDFDRAVLKALENTIVYVVSQGGLLHPNTIEARNFLIMEGKDCKEIQKRLH